MSLTFFAKSFAYSWKMSFVGQVLCKRSQVVCARETIGAAIAAAPTAPADAVFKNRRRCAGCCLLMSRLLWCVDGVLAAGPLCGRKRGRGLTISGGAAGG